jgi:hypothetical protein
LRLKLIYLPWTECISKGFINLKYYVYTYSHLVQDAIASANKTPPNICEGPPNLIPSEKKKLINGLNKIMMMR